MDARYGMQNGYMSDSLVKFSKIQPSKETHGIKNLPFTQYLIIRLTVS